MNLRDPFLRDLLIRALIARRRERIAQEPELLLISSTYDSGEAVVEADKLLTHMRAIAARTAGTQ